MNLLSYGRIGIFTVSVIKGHNIDLCVLAYANKCCHNVPHERWVKPKYAIGTRIAL
jgi:hypothetical protein